MLKAQASSPILPELRSCVKVEAAVSLPKSPNDLCGRKAPLKEQTKTDQSCGKVEMVVPGWYDGPYGLCGRKVTLNSNRFLTLPEKCRAEWRGKTKSKKSTLPPPTPRRKKEKKKRTSTCSAVSKTVQ